MSTTERQGDGRANLASVTREDWILGGLALMLAIDLLFFPWFDFTIGAGGITFSLSSTATGSPSGWLGVLAMFCALAFVADLAVERLSPQTKVPSIGDSRAATRLALAAGAAACIALKFLFHVHFSRFGWGFYLAVVLAAALVYFAVQARQAELDMPRSERGRRAATPGAGPSRGAAGAGPSRGTPGPAPSRPVRPTKPPTT